MRSNLRNLLELAAGEPPVLLTVDAIRRRATRRRVAQVGAAALAAVLTAGLATTVASGGLPGSPAASKSGKTFAPPRYYMQKYFNGRTAALVVRATATGRITATIAAPRPGMNCADGNVGIVPAGKQTFFMNCVIWHENPGPRGKTTFLESFIYRFQVTAAGRVSGLSLVKGGVLKGVWAYNMAAAPDGSQVAAEVIRPGPSGLIYTDSVPEGIFVIDTRTGARVLWRTGPYRPGTVQYADGRQLSFTRDGSELVVLEGRCKRGRYLANCLTQETQLRAYSPAGLGGSLEAGRVLLPNRQLLNRNLLGAVISPDGFAVTALLNDCSRRGPCGTLSVARISVITGGVLRVLGQVHTAYAPTTFASDPSGRYFIVVVSDGHGARNGWIDHGRLVPLAPSGSDVQQEAW